MSEIRLVRDYPHPPEKVWRVLTTPELMAKLGMRPEGFSPVVGTAFKFMGMPNPGWRGYVDVEVLEATPTTRLRYRWDDDGYSRPTEVSYTLEPRGGGTRITLVHSGFQGFGGFVFKTLMMGPGLRSMLDKRLPKALAEV